MRLRVQSREQYGAKLGYLDAEGNPSIRKIAGLLRAPLSRWGLSPKRAVLEYARNELRACGVDDVSSVPSILQRLIDLGECDAVLVGHEPFLAPATPRWISVGEGVSAYLGVSEAPEELKLVNNEHNDIVRRLRVSTDEDAEILELTGVQEMSLEEWLLPPDYFRYIARRTRKLVRSDATSLGSFWDILVNTMAEEGLPLGFDAEVRFLGGQPGTYFGNFKSLKLEGRWTFNPGEGLWCAYRHGYSDGHWHPCIVSVTGDDRRVLDLYNEDEWKWAVLARGRSTGDEEIVQRSDEIAVKLTFQAPNQLKSAMDILGRPCGPWTWEMSPCGPDLWQLIK